VTWEVTADESGSRLDKFLAAPERLRSRGRAADALGRGKIFVNDLEVTLADAARRLAPGDAVRAWIDRPGSARRQHSAPSLDIVFEDQAIILVNKPAGLLTVPLARRGDAPALSGLLEASFRAQGKKPPLAVHRIDRDTSGLVLFARNPRAQLRLKDQFRKHEPDRVYWAVVYGVPHPLVGTWRDHIVWDQEALIQKETHPKDPRAAEAISGYRVLERFAATSLMEVRLQTGKRNQIRLQARLRGHMLVGEQRYVYGPDHLRPVAFPRQALHARQLGLRHPDTGAAVVFEAPLPTDMAELIDRLRAGGG
jgi:23S rRNA pseudouridine1911/1915/1917 synthase